MVSQGVAPRFNLEDEQRLIALCVALNGCENLDDPGDLGSPLDELREAVRRQKLYRAIKKNLADQGEV